MSNPKKVQSEKTPISQLFSLDPDMQESNKNDNVVEPNNPLEEEIEFNPKEFLLPQEGLF